MRYIKPTYYDEFKCIADKCPDTCCAGWQIVIDEETLDKYQTFVEDTVIHTVSGDSADAEFAETFAESWTKFICESLSDDCKTFKKNPLDLIRAMPKEFQEILKKVSQVEFLNWRD